MHCIGQALSELLRATSLLTIACGAITALVMTLPGQVSYGQEADRAASQPSYRSPTAVAISPDGKTLYVTDRTAGSVAILDPASRTKRGELALRGRPQGVALSDSGDTLYVAEHGAGSVAVVDAATLEVAARIAVGKWPAAVAVAPQTKRLYVCNQDNHTVSVIDLAQDPAKPIEQIAVVREPVCIAVTPDERRVVVANLLAHGVGTDTKLAAEVSVIDTTDMAQAATIKLPSGSTVVRGICVSPDGRWAYAVHGLGRFMMPITQLERGWVNTFALSILDLAEAKRLATVLLDDLTQGAADPYSVVCSKDGKRLWISHAGVHEISMIDMGRMHELLAGKVPDDLAARKDGARPNIWVRIRDNPAKIVELQNDLTALYIAGVIRRTASGGKGPRGIVLSPDEQQLLVANYYSGSVALLNAHDGKLQGTIALGPQAEADAARRGEFIFHDADHTFQRWHSCATCHANEGHVDGLRWDFLGDGMGNGKDTLSLVYLHHTEPLNRRATTATAWECAQGGLESTNMLVPSDQDVKDLYAYMTSLRPQASPHLTADGQLSSAAQRGKTLFEGKADCAGCHPGPYFTDQKMHNVGVTSSNEPDGRYDTPSLIEAYRTAPYLHDGRALTIKDVLTTHNHRDAHGKTSSLSKEEINDLCAYLLSL